MCKNFQCKKCILELSSSGSALYYCSKDKSFNFDCSSCSVSGCRNCRSSSVGVNHDAAFKYFSEVIKNGEEFQVTFV